MIWLSLHNTAQRRVEHSSPISTPKGLFPWRWLRRRSEPCSSRSARTWTPSGAGTPSRIEPGERTRSPKRRWWRGGRSSRSSMCFGRWEGGGFGFGRGGIVGGGSKLGSNKGLCRKLEWRRPPCISLCPPPLLSRLLYLASPSPFLVWVRRRMWWQERNWKLRRPMLQTYS